MPAAPQPSPEETLCNQAFEAVLWALSRPGMPRTLPQPGEGAIIDALIDRECRAHSPDPQISAHLARSGAQMVDLPQAEYVFLPQLAQPEALRDLALGSDLYPDEGATVVLRASLGQGQALRLSGPGVKDALTCHIGDVPVDLWHIRTDIQRYPMGFDLILLDGDQIIGLPRSTHIEVL